MSQKTDSSADSAQIMLVYIRRYVIEQQLLAKVVRSKFKIQVKPLCTRV